MMLIYCKRILRKETLENYETFQIRDKLFFTNVYAALEGWLSYCLWLRGHKFEPCPTSDVELRENKNTSGKGNVLWF